MIVGEDENSNVFLDIECIEFYGKLFLNKYWNGVYLVDCSSAIEYR